MPVQSHRVAVESTPEADRPTHDSGLVVELVAGLQAAGVAVDSAAVAAWLAGVAAAAVTPEEFVISHAGGFGGHELALLDFEPAMAERLRRVGRAIAMPATPGVRTALAIAGSAAQGKIQPYPVDLDFFERVHLTAPTKEEAGRRLADLIRANVAAPGPQPGLVLREVHFGSVPNDPAGGPARTVGVPARSALRWTPAQVAAGERSVTRSGGDHLLTWDEAAADPGFVKLDWVLTDRALGGPGKVSKVVDATWQGPDGRPVSLDGLLDADYQQIYLDPDAAELAAFLTRGLPAGEREGYVGILERQIHAYARGDPPDFGKVAKRLYNICRLTGRHAEALFIRELFDDPAARLLQARTRLELIADACDQDLPGACADLRTLLTSLDDAFAATGAPAAVASLLDSRTEPRPEKLRTALAALETAFAEGANRAFERRLRAYPPVAALLAEIDVRVAGQR